MNNDLFIAFIGGGNMANALSCGLAGRVCPAANIHVIDINTDLHAQWRARGMSVSGEPDAALSRSAIWIYAVKPQLMREVVAASRQWLKEDTLVVSIAAGIRGDTLAGWLGQPDAPWRRLVRCMPNMPALIGAGASGLAATCGVTDVDRDNVTRIFQAVGEVVWVSDDAGLDAVTALSGSGPAYVFLFLEALIEGGKRVGLDAAQARQLALATLAGATRLAAESPESPAVLRDRVTSKGGTTAAALQSFSDAGFTAIVVDALDAAAKRSREMAAQFQ